MFYTNTCSPVKPGIIPSRERAVDSQAMDEARMTFMELVFTCSECGAKTTAQVPISPELMAATGQTEVKTTVLVRCSGCEREIEFPVTGTFSPHPPH
jgi:hypothetical protein